MSILIEHYAGNFPFWLAPTQVSILPIGEQQHEYANKVMKIITDAGFRCEIDLRSEKVSRKIAESEQQKIPFAFIIGKKEEESNSVSLREHLKGDIGSKTLEEINEIFSYLNIPGNS
jgi:threonyl-tRNA synthetase